MREESKMAAFSNLSLVLATLVTVFSLFQAPAFAVKRPHVVYMGVHSPGQGDSPFSESKVQEDSYHHHEFLAPFLGSTEKAKEAIIQSYTREINGFAANLEEEEAAAIARHPNVVSVFLNKGKHLHTTHSWEFMMLENEKGHHSRLWRKSRHGEGIIIGNLDTGVWPESRSFCDHGYGPVPSRWKGLCENNTRHGVRCNRKLIGASYFDKSYVASGAKIDSAKTSARDVEGHGSHTLSTAGGNIVHGASVFGVFNGTAKGGSPKARVAAYKVCWPASKDGGCYDGDILEGFETAIHDGVDVLSVSLGGPPADYFEDAVAIGAFHAAKHGIVTVCSAGNDGPTDGSVTNVAPWIITVGASTLDREFANYVELQNGERFKGTSLSASVPGGAQFYPLISAAHAKAHNATAEEAILCLEGKLDPEKVKGKILVCLRGKNGRVEKGVQAKNNGAVGMILCNDESTGNEIIADPHFLPASQIIYTDGVAVFRYVNTTKNPMGFITGAAPQLGTKPAPFMAAFSSKGPNTVTPEILKPDITAPGVNIIAAYTGDHSPSEYDNDDRRTGYSTMSGTSMSCPHVAGVTGLLKKLHPDWSPAAVKSAIMTTARTRDNTVNPMLNGSFVKANPFSYGAGHIRPNRAMDPGLVYDLKTNDYLDFVCALGYNHSTVQLFSQTHYGCPKNVSLLDFNYPSITVPNLSVGSSVTVHRTLKNVGKPATYASSIRQPRGVSVSVTVEPKILKFDKIGEEKSFKLTLKNNGHRDHYAFGELLWSDGLHYVRSPIVVASNATTASIQSARPLETTGRVRR